MPPKQPALLGVLFLRTRAFIASIFEAPPAVPPRLPIPQSTRILSPEEIAAALDGAVMRYAAVGYRLVSRSPSMAQMVKPKSFSGWSLLLLFLWVFPFLIYLFVYWAERDESVLITIAPNGVISAVKPQ